MKRQLLVAGAVTVMVAGTVLGGLSPAGASSAVSVPAAAPIAASVLHACGSPSPGHAGCLAELSPSVQARTRTPSATVVPPTDGYGPADITSIYHLDRTAGGGRTIAIVDAYDNPNAEADLAAYRSAWKLPACTTANKCFHKINQHGGTTPPEGDPGWGVEIALDLQAASAACPLCHLLLVEADSSSFDDLGAAVNRAVNFGAHVVSNSYGGDEFNGILGYASTYYNHAGVAVVASSGDAGFGPASFPAVSPRVIGVGGTSVTKTPSGWKQTAWEGAGSGCSAWFAKPSWQKDTNCPMRTSSDVSALADPNTGLAVYDTYDLEDVFGVPNGWVVVGGTSLAAPLVAAMIALAGNAATLDTAKSIYTHSSALTDVVGGSNGYCGGDYLCTAVKGYDGPTGLGTPRGVGAL